MIKVLCHTNLDLRGEEWPTELPAVPRVGDKIESKTRREGNFSLTLVVVSVIWAYYIREDAYVPEIELHLNKNVFNTITDFYNWYTPKLGTTASAFI